MSRRARVITASSRAASGVYPDRGGPLVVAWLRECGFDVPDSTVVADGEPVGAALRGALAERVDLVITTGGTGISPHDHTPEQTRAVLDREIPGLADAIRHAGLPSVPTAVLSRGLAGAAGGTLVVNLPGSTGGVRDGLAVLDGVLAHALDQLAGGDHVSTRSERPASEVLRADVTAEPLDAEAIAASVQHRAAGALVRFDGIVRDHDGGRGVRELEYVGHPSADEVMRETVDEVVAGRPGVRAVAASHRIGLLGIGDAALVCVVAAEHRAQAFQTCSDLVDEVKRRLPMWKRQVFDDDSEEWVNCP